MKLLYIDGTFHSEALLDGGLVELLACAEFLHDTGLLKLTLELLQGLLNVLAFFYGYYNHCCFLLLIMLVNRVMHTNAAQNYTYFSN